MDLFASFLIALQTACLCFFTSFLYDFNKIVLQGSGQVANPHVLYRNTVVENIQNKHAVVSLVAENLARYMEKIRQLHETEPDVDPVKLVPDGRYSHSLQFKRDLIF